MIEITIDREKENGITKIECKEEKDGVFRSTIYYNLNGVEDHIQLSHFQVLNGELIDAHFALMAIKHLNETLINGYNIKFADTKQIIKQIIKDYL